MLCIRCGVFEGKQYNQWCENCLSTITDKTDLLVSELRESFDAGPLDNAEVTALLQHFACDMLIVLTNRDPEHFCTKCGQNYLTHNDDGSCVEDKD